MTQELIRHAIESIGRLQQATNPPLIEVLRPWMVITGLTFKDALHVSYADLQGGLDAIHEKLNGVLDVLDEDQLQEAACRCLKTVTVYGEMMKDGDVAVRHGQNIEWDGNAWNYVTDPKLRQRGSSKSYAQAMTAVREMVGT